MLVKTVSLKFIGIFSALVNMLTLGVYLDPAISVKILASLSVIQISIPYTAFGISTNLIGKKEEDFQGKSLGTTLPKLLMFVGLLCVLHMLLLGGMSGVNSGLIYILFYIFILQLITGLAEIVRAAFGVINGFLAYNVVLLCSSLELYVHQEISVISLLCAMAALLWLFFKYFLPGEGSSDIDTKISVSGLKKSVSTSIVNQYMHIVTVFATFIGLQTETLAIFAAASRLNILFSWPIFMWMRVGHKELAIPNSFTKLEQKNVKAKYINAVCLCFVVIAFVIAEFTPLVSDIRLFGIAINSLLLVTVIWGGVRVALLWMFPFETIYVHRGEWMWLFILTAMLLIIGVVVIKIFYLSPLYLMLYIELVFFALRLFFKRIKLSET